MSKSKEPIKEYKEIVMEITQLFERISQLDARLIKIQIPEKDRIESQRLRALIPQDF